MKKILSSILILMLFFAVGGCSFSINKDFNINDYSDTINKSDRIDVLKNNKRIDLISGHSNIEDFVDAIKINEWKIKDLPESEVTDLEFILFKKEAQKSTNDKKDNEFIQVASIVTYKDSNYVTLKLSNISFDFKVPDDVKDYFNTFI